MSTFSFCNNVYIKPSAVFVLKCHYVGKDELCASYSEHNFWMLKHCLNHFSDKTELLMSSQQKRSWNIVWKEKLLQKSIFSLSYNNFKSVQKIRYLQIFSTQKPLELSCQVSGSEHIFQSDKQSYYFARRNNCFFLWRLQEKDI